MSYSFNIQYNIMHAPCSSSVQWSYCSRCQSLYWLHSGRVHMSGCPTNHEDIAARPYKHTHTHTVRFDQIPMYLGQIWHGERDSTTQREREMEPTDKREQMRLPLLWRIWLSVCEFEVGVELGSHESQSVGKLKSTFIHSKPANLKHTRIHAAKQNKCIINMNTNSFAIHIQSYR